VSFAINSGDEFKVAVCKTFYKINFFENGIWVFNVATQYYFSVVANIVPVHDYFYPTAKFNGALLKKMK